jgi:lipid-binding SYLF domain-containing protein
MNASIAKKGWLAALLGAFVFVAGCSTTSPGRGDPVAQRAAIDAGVDNALQTLFRQEPSSRDLVNRARAVLVFPNVLEAGFVFGAKRGDGALRINGRTASYHRVTSGTFGLQAGAQSTAVFLLFMTDDALKRFQDSRGWTTGVDASVTLLTAGANAGVSTNTVQQPVIGYVLSNQGLMAGLTIDGTRITRINF